MKSLYYDVIDNKEEYAVPHKQGRSRHLSHTTSNREHSIHKQEIRNVTYEEVRIHNPVWAVRKG